MIWRMNEGPRFSVDRKQADRRLHTFFLDARHNRINSGEVLDLFLKALGLCSHELLQQELKWVLDGFRKTTIHWRHVGNTEGEG